MIKNLKKLRNEKGISQQYLAGVLGVSQQSINKYENHNVEPDIALLISMADFFNTTIDYLVGRSETQELSSNISTKESHLVEQYRRLNDSEKQCIDVVISTYLNSQNK